MLGAYYREAQRHDAMPPPLYMTYNTALFKSPTPSASQGRLSDTFSLQHAHTECERGAQQSPANTATHARRGHADGIAGTILCAANVPVAVVDMLPACSSACNLILPDTAAA